MMKISCHRLILTITLGIFLLTTIDSFSRPLRPDLVEKLKQEGKFEEYRESMLELRQKGLNAPSTDKFRRSDISQSAGPDTMRAVVLLLEFWDNRAYGPVGVDATPEYFDTLFNYEGAWKSGSMRSFYKENSYDQFVFVADVYGWYLMDSTYDYYVDSNRGFGTYPQNAQGMVRHALELTDSEIDFSQYDNDGDNYVDALIIVHAGPGYEETLDVTMIHSHKWNLDSTFTSDDGTYLFEYNMNPEESAGYYQPTYERINIGVFCHEFGHTLGLPDLYDTDYSSSGVGAWSLMASGSYNGDSKTPAHLDAWCKKEMGWIVPDVISESIIDHPFPEIITSGYAARLWTDGDSTNPEYFLIENRQRKGFDSQLPGEGLLIWHVDETQGSNRNEYNYLVGLEQADGLFQLEAESHYGGDPNDSYPGGLGKREFSEVTIPASFTNPYPVYPDTNGLPDTTYAAVWGISDSDSLMYANLDVNYTRPRYELIDYFLNEINGDGDQYTEPGETHGLSVIVTNYRADAQDVHLYIDIDNELIEIQQDSILLGDLPGNGMVDNIASPIEFSIPEGLESTISNLTFKVKDPSNSDSLIVVQRLNLGTPKILLVDNDNLHFEEYETYYTDIFDSLKLPYVYYCRDTMGTPGSEYLNFENIVWFSSFDSLSSSDVDFLESYLDGGGRLFLTGQNIAEGLASGPDSLFLRDYLKCDYDSSQNRYAWLYGIDGSYIGSDSLRLLLSFDGASNQDSRDLLKDIDPEASANLFYVYGGEVQGVAGLEYIGNYKLVFWAFGLEGLTSISPVVSTRLQAMQKVLDFLENGISTDVEDEQEISDQVPRQFALDQNYPNPFNPQTRISYQLDRSTDNVTLKVYNILGQEVRTLVNEPQDAGFYEVVWDSRDDSGNPVATGIYFYRLQADNLTETRKMVLLK